MEYRWINFWLCFTTLASMASIGRTEPITPQYCFRCNSWEDPVCRYDMLTDRYLALCAVDRPLCATAWNKSHIKRGCVQPSGCNTEKNCCACKTNRCNMFSKMCIEAGAAMFYVKQIVLFVPVFIFCLIV